MHYKQPCFDIGSPLVKGRDMTDLAELRDRLNALCREGRPAWESVSSGLPELDAALPGGGFRGGTLVEWLAERPGAGATSCAVRTAAQAMTGGRPLVVVDSGGSFHPPGLGNTVDWRRVLLVRCGRGAEADWAAEQALRTSGVGAVLAQFDGGDERRLRRWQLAAEHGGAVGLVVRYVARQSEACFSDIRIRVTPLPSVEGRRVRLELLRCRQGGRGTVIDVRLDDDAHTLSENISAPRRRSARA